MTATVSLTIDGRTVATGAGSSILQASAADGTALTENVGCLGQGVCGACRCLVRRAGSREVTTALACETPAEAGMQVSFIDYFLPQRSHRYDLADIVAAPDPADAILAAFPEARHCRHCSGCDRACPKGLAVQDGVALAVAGDLPGAAAAFDQCVMCNLCTLACPERIAPNHLGLLVRRALSAAASPPGELLRRLDEIGSGAARVEWGA